ncbi:MAG TPA: aldo/keto reductase [Phycisphaerae bacterium]|nr:aldo/keto reductase [Phycisphaerae bacterium]
MAQQEWTAFGQRSGLKVHRVSIGAMRLPKGDDEAVTLLRQAIDAGLIYIDTSRGYGDSEIKVGKSLKDGYRSRVILSTKWSPWVQMVEETDRPTAACTYKRLLESMERLDVDRLDFYQLWNIDSLEHWQQATGKGGMLEGILRARKEGLVGHIGFTTHDSPGNISRYIDEADWCEAILFTYNVMNQTYRENIAKAHAKGIATLVMNPIGGGMLAENSPVLTAAAGGLDPIEAAHRFLSGDPNVDTVLCGIRKPSDITDTLANFAKPPLVGGLRSTIVEAYARLSKKNLGLCTDCQYCMPCPQGLNIPGIMHTAYLHRVLQCPEAAANHYRWIADPAKNTTAENCTQCGECGSKCTQKLPIPEHVGYVARHLDSGSQGKR